MVLPFFHPCTYISLPCKFLITNIRLDNNHANNYYWFISIQLLLFLLYTRFHSSPVEHEYLSSKVEFMGNSTKFFKIRFLRCVKNKNIKFDIYLINVVSWVPILVLDIPHYLSKRAVATIAYTLLQMPNILRYLRKRAAASIAYSLLQILNIPHYLSKRAADRRSLSASKLCRYREVADWATGSGFPNYWKQSTQHN